MPESLPLEEMIFTGESLVRLKPKPLDNTLGRVILPHQISLIHSSERKPLTTLAHAIAAGGVLEGGQSVFIDSGTNFSPSLMRALLGKDEDLLKNVVIGQVLELADLQDLAQGIGCMRDVRVVVVDSLTGVLNLSGRCDSKYRQRALHHTLEVLRILVNDNDLHVTLTDHSSMDWTSGTTRPVGGNVVAHGVDTTIHIASMDMAEDGLRIQVERSPVHPIPDPVVVKLSIKGARTLRGTR
ncbi:MAG: hypothetical protein AM326_07020 [Candidatus Thorarchaeota archaeon SMTZ-45]|nr:MAG: hypothetical protein AM326_07020 [Candidatus Thorarchaeota archaeon SMTZ-45]